VRVPTDCRPTYERVPLIVAFLLPSALLAVRVGERQREGLKCAAATPHRRTARSFTIGDSDFLLDGEPFRVLSGAIRHFHVRSIA
jgi:hypothetical protein